MLQMLPRRWLEGAKVSRIRGMAKLFDLNFLSEARLYERTGMCGVIKVNACIRPKKGGLPRDPTHITNPNESRKADANQTSSPVAGSLPPSGK